MRSKLFKEKSQRMQTGLERWVQIIPKDNVYQLYDPANERELGRILYDEGENWIYDGRALTIEEQEEVAGFIGGHQKEMDDLLKSLSVNIAD